MSKAAAPAMAVHCTPRPVPVKAKEPEDALTVPGTAEPSEVAPLPPEVETLEVVLEVVLEVELEEEPPDPEPPELAPLAPDCVADVPVVCVGLVPSGSAVDGGDTVLADEATIGDIGVAEGARLVMPVGRVSSG